MKTTNVTVKINGISALTFTTDIEVDYDMHVVNMTAVKILMMALNDFVNEAAHEDLQAKYAMNLIWELNGYNTLKRKNFNYKHALGCACCDESIELELYATKAA